MIMMRDSEAGEVNKFLGDVYGEYKKVISKEDAKVVVIGPSVSVFSDPTLLLTAHLTGKKGDLYVVDPRDQIEDRVSSNENTAVGILRTSGNINNHLRQMGLFKKIGMNLMSPKWLGKESDIKNIKLPDNSVDVIVDHSTSTFLAEVEAYRDFRLHFVPTRDAYLKTCFDEYQRVLKDGGCLLLQANVEHYCFGRTEIGMGKQVLMDLLEGGGFEVEYKKINNVLKIPIDDVVLDVLKEDIDTDKWGTFDGGDLHELKKRIVQDQNKHFIQFNDSSPDLFVAKKIPR